MGVSARSEIAAGFVLANEDPEAVRAAVITRPEEFLPVYLHKSTVWQSADLPPQLRGQVALGQSLSRWRPQDVPVDEAQALEAAWLKALPPLDRGIRRYLRVRVGSPQDARRLRQLGSVDGLIIVPSLDSRGSMRPFTWRWPFRVGVVEGPLAAAWLQAVRDTSHYGHVFDAELFNADATYDIAIVSSGGLSTLTANVVGSLGRTACVIVAGDEPVERRLLELEGRLEPSIAVAVAAPPAQWWQTLLNELSHDVPIDAAVETVVRMVGVDALIAGPSYGMDITASAHWFAAVAPYFPQLAPSLHTYAHWDWQSEGGGSRTVTDQVRAVRAQGEDPVVQFPDAYFGEDGELVDALYVEERVREFPDALYGEEEEEEEEEYELPDAYPGEEAVFDEEGEEEEEKVEKPPKPRRLVVRMYDGETVLESVLPPKRDLQLAVRIAIPERGDVAADEVMPEPFEEPGPTVQLEVLLRSDMWREQPPPQTISMPKDKETEPSSWAVFALTTPDAGSVVSIEIVVLYQGKPLQAATYESPVRTSGLPGERPTLRTFRLSGPDEPTDDLKPVDATLDGRGADLRHKNGRHGTVLITDAQDMLDTIEERVSQVLGVPGAPDTFDHPDALRLLIDLARTGSRFATFLAPLRLDKSKSINVSVNDDTPVLPLELVYAGPTPDENLAKLCRHVEDPPPMGKPCDRASVRRVCPYAFWGLHRSISRTVWSKESHRSSSPGQGPAYTVLYAATVIADDGAKAPKPSDSVLAAAQNLFSPVTRVTSWRAWRTAVEGAGRPNLLVVLGHADVTGIQTRIYIGRRSAVSDLDLAKAMLGVEGGHDELVLLIACASGMRGGPFGTLPGALTAKGAGAVVGTLSKIIGPQGATATMHLLDSLHSAVGKESVGVAVARARYTLVKEKRPIGLILVSHGELDTKAGA